MLETAGLSPSHTPSVFISYAREDRSFVERLHRALRSIDRDAWVDWEGIPPTAEWLEEVRAAIEGASAVIFVLTPDSLASHICGLELDHAVRHNKRLIPVVCRELGDREVPAPLAKLNWLFFRDDHEFDRTFDALIQALDTDLDWTRTHTRLLQRVMEWDRKGRERSLLLRGSDLREAELWLARDKPGRDPQPTQLQRDYIAGGRRAERRRRRTLLGAIGLVLTVCAVAAVMILRGRTALFQDHRLLLSQKLARDAEDLLSNSNLSLAGLLAAESLLRLPTPEATEVLCRILEAQSRPAFSAAHQGVGEVVGYSPDGSRLVTIASNDPVTVWDAQNGAPLARMTHPDAITFVLSADGKRLITVGKQTVHVWSLPTGQSLGGSDLRNQIVAARFRPDGQPVVFQVAGSTVVVSDAVTGAETARYDTGSKFDELTISDNGSYFATGNSGYEVRVWEALTGRQAATADTPGAISGLVFSTTGKWLGGKSYFDTAVIWEAATGRQKAVIPLKGESNLKLRFSPNEESLAVTTGQAIHVFDIASGGERARSDGKADLLGFSPNGAFIAAADSGRVRLLDAATGGELARIEYNRPNSFAFSPDNHRFAVTGWEDATRVFEARGSWHQQAKRLVSTGQVQSLAISPDGSHIAAFFDPWGAALWDRGGNRLGIGNRAERVQALTFSPDGQYLATAEGDVARVWRSDTGAKVAEIPGKDLRAVSFSRDGASLATAGADGVNVWDFKSGREVASTRFQIGLEAAILSPGALYLAQSNGFTVDVYEVASRRRLASTQQQQDTSVLAFSPSGNLLATATWAENSARVWQTHGGRCVAQLQHEDKVEGLAFSPDERYLATTSSNAAQVWDLIQQRPVARVKQAGRGAVAFSYDGKYLVSGSSDGTIVFSVWRPDDLVQEVCRNLFVNLSDEQWNEYIGTEPYRKTCQHLAEGKD